MGRHIVGAYGTSNKCIEITRWVFLLNGGKPAPTDL